MNICPVCEKETLRKAADFVECIDKDCGFYADGDDMTDALQFEYRQVVRSQLSKLTELEKDNAALRARVGELEQERDAAVSDLQDAVDFVYKVYGESNETLAAITTGHWRVVIASAKGAK